MWGGYGALPAMSRANLFAHLYLKPSYSTIHIPIVAIYSVAMILHRGIMNITEGNARCGDAAATRCYWLTSHGLTEYVFVIPVGTAVSPQTTKTHNKPHHSVLAHWEREDTAAMTFHNFVLGKLHKQTPILLSTNAAHLPITSYASIYAWVDARGCDNAYVCTRA